MSGNTENNQSKPAIIDPSKFSVHKQIVKKVMTANTNPAANPATIRQPQVEQMMLRGYVDRDTLDPAIYGGLLSDQEYRRLLEKAASSGDYDHLLHKPDRSKGETESRSAAASMTARQSPLSDLEYRLVLDRLGNDEGAMTFDGAFLIDPNRRIRPEWLAANPMASAANYPNRMFLDMTGKPNPAGVDYAGDHLPFKMPTVVPRKDAERMIGNSPAAKLAKEYLFGIRGKTAVLDQESLEDKEAIESFLLTHQIQFIVEHDWHSALSKIIKDVQDNEIQLPYAETIFEFSYMETPMRGTIYQDPNTYEIKLGNVYISTASAEVFEVRPWYLANAKEAAVFLEHVRYTCVALETELSVKQQQPMLDFLKALKPAQRKLLKAPSVTYKILPVRKHEPKEGSVVPVVGSKQRFHVRRSHWKMVKGERRRIKWYFAGNIELGFVVKDYKLD